MNNKIHLSLLFLLTVFFTNCSDSMVSELFVPSISNQFLYVTPNSLSFNEIGESKTITVTSMQTPWRFADYPEWITISPSSGEGNAKVTITAETNPSAEISRTHVFYLESADPKWNYKSYISVSQKKANAYITTFPNSITFDAAGGTKNIEIKANVKWEAKCNTTWLTINQAEQAILLTAQENTTGQSRTTTIQLNGNGITANIDVVQQAGGVTCSVEELTFEQYGDSKTFTINAQTSWILSTSNDWILVSPASGIAGISEIRVNIDDNFAPSERYGYIYIKVDNKAVSQIKIIQKGIYLYTDANDLLFDPQSESKSISVSSNTSWNVFTSQDWLKVSDMAGKGDCVLTIRVEENISNENRSGYITIKSEDGIIEKCVDVTQLGVSISTDTQNLYFPYNGGTQILGISSNTDWNVLSTISWLSFSPMKGTKEDYSTAITANETDSEKERNATFYVKANGLQEEINVRQEGKFFYISEDALTVSAASNTVNLGISTSESWTASSSVTWLKLEQSSGNGNANIIINISENVSSDNRIGIVTFSPADGRQIKLVITQKCRVLEVTPSFITLNYKGDAQYVSVVAEGNYSVSSSTEWIEITNVSNTGFNVSSTELNETEYTKTGFITCKLNGTNISKTIYVEQSKIPDYIDLGLPSGTKWCRFNYGAKSPEDFGTECTWSAWLNSGKKPTRKQVEELISLCTWTWKDIGHDPFSSKVNPTAIVTIEGPNGNSIKLPMTPWAGWATECYYWIDEKYSDTEAYYFGENYHGYKDIIFGYKRMTYNQFSYIRTVSK